MIHALSLMLWLAAAQTAGEPAAAPAAAPVTAPAAAPAGAPATAVIHEPVPGGDEGALRARFDEARGQLAKMRVQLDRARREVAKLKEESGMADHAVAALLVSGRPGLVPLKKVAWRHTTGGGLRRIRHFEAAVYMSPEPAETLAAVVLTVRNPREAPTWEPKEAYLTTPAYRLDPPVPVTLRSSPERIRPGETGRIALVFDIRDMRFDEPYATLSLLRDGEWETEIELQPCDFLVDSAIPEGAQ